MKQGIATHRKKGRGNAAQGNLWHGRDTEDNAKIGIASKVNQRTLKPTAHLHDSVRFAPVCGSLQ